MNVHTSRDARWILAVAGAVAMSLTAPKAMAAKGPHEAADFSAAYAEHPTVAKVKATGYLTVLDRERALSERTPMDRSLAIVDAVGAKNAARFKVDDAMARALRARYSLGPSGALLDKKIPYTAMSARAALTLGWLRALAVKKTKQLGATGTSIRDASALQLLQHAAAKAPAAQAPQLALALLKATLAGKRGKCAAWKTVQAAARNGGKESVALAAAEGAAKAVRKLARKCGKKERGMYSRPISLPAQAAESAPPPQTGRSQAGRPTQRSGDVYRKGVAFTAVAPVFKGYMEVPLVRDIIRRVRLDQVKLYEVMKADQTGDTSVAVLNATLWSRRLPPDRIADVAWQAVLRGRNLLSNKGAAAALPISKLSPVEAMVLGYARVAAGWGLERPELPGDPPAENALPRQLFRHGRGKLPMTATLGPIMAMLHTVDLQRQGHLCRAAKRADSVAFVTKKSALPEASKRVILGATDTVRSQCASLGGATK